LIKKINKLPKNYKGYEFNAPPDLGVIGTKFKVLNAFPVGVKVFHSVYKNKKDFNNAVLDIKDLIDNEKERLKDYDFIKRM